MYLLDLATDERGHLLDDILVMRPAWAGLVAMEFSRLRVDEARAVRKKLTGWNPRNLRPSWCFAIAVDSNGALRA